MFILTLKDGTTKQDKIINLSQSQGIKVEKNKLFSTLYHARSEGV